ncbi:MAG: SdpI family protein [Chitinophagaceae bacterium]
MKKQLQLSICIFVSIAPLIYLASIWHGMPLTVPTHFDLQGVPNDYTSKGALWIINGGMAGLGIGLFLLFRNLHRIDPKRNGKQPSSTFDRLAIGTPIFLSAINLVTILAADNVISVNKILFPLLGLLFAFLGNIMYSIKPNYFAGIRLPWTLADDSNWRATHRLAGWIWFTGGLLLVLSSFLLPSRFMGSVMLSLIGLMVGIPSIYSFLYFKRHQGQL